MGITSKRSKGMIDLERKTLIIVVILIIAVIGVGVAIFSISKGVIDPYEQQIKLGYKLLAEGQYEEAILAFDKAITIEAKRDNAYIGKADTYLAKGGDDMVTMINKTLTTGYEMTQSDIIADTYIRLANELIALDKADLAVILMRFGHEVTGNEKLKEKIDELVKEAQDFTPSEFATMEAVYRGIISEDYEFLFDHLEKVEFTKLFDDTKRMERTYPSVEDDWKFLWLSEHGEVVLRRIGKIEPYSYDIEFGSRENGTNYRLWFNRYWDIPTLFLYIVENKNGLGNGEYRDYCFKNKPIYDNNIEINSGKVVNGLLEGTETRYCGNNIEGEDEFTYSYSVYYENGIEQGSERSADGAYLITHHIGGYYDNNGELQYSHYRCIEYH